MCSVWTERDGKSILTHISQVPLTGDLDSARGNDKIFNAILEQAFKSLASEIQIDGHDAFVTIPDYWVYHDFTEMDASMGADDSWDYILWQKEQRLGDKQNNFLTYAENIQGNLKHVIHVPTLLMSDIKLTISEHGAEPSWLGTESMVFTGPTKHTFGVISDSGNGYDLFVIKRNNLFAGSIRSVQGEWKVSKSFGFKSEIESLLTFHKKSPKKFLTPVYTLDTLSDKKQKHWSNTKLKHIKPFSKSSIENTVEFDTMSNHLLSIQSLFVDNSFSRSKMNLFSAAGLIEKIEAPQVEEEKSENITNELHQDKKSKGVKKKNKQNYLEKAVMFLTTVIIILSFAMSIYLKKSGDESTPNIGVIEQPASSSVEVSIPVNENIHKYPQQLMDIMHNSISMTFGFKYVYESLPYNTVTFLSMSERDLQLEIVDGEELDADLLPLGSMVNYNVQGIECCGGFKHFYDFVLPMSSDALLFEMDSAELLQASFSNLNVEIKKLEKIENGNFPQIPFIIKVYSEEQIKAAFSVLLKMNHNIVFRKIVVKTHPETGESQSVFYISVFERKGD